MRIAIFTKKNKMESSEDKPQPKKKRVTKSADSIKSADSSFSSEQIKRLLKEALMDNMIDHKKRTNLEIDAMISTMEEFLRSFILIGYNIKNEPITITHAKSQLDADALYTALSRLFFSINSSGQM